MAIMEFDLLVALAQAAAELDEAGNLLQNEYPAHAKFMKDAAQEKKDLIAKYKATN